MLFRSATTAEAEAAVLAAARTGDNCTPGASLIRSVNKNLVELAALIVIMLTGSGKYAGLDRFVTALLGRRPDGLILTGSRHPKRARRMIADARIPVVEMWELRAVPERIEMASDAVEFTVVQRSSVPTSASLVRMIRRACSMS